MLDMVSGRFIGVARRLLRVTMRDQRLMRRISVIVLAVMRRGLAMMLRGFLVMIGRGDMMLFAGEDLAHACLHGLPGDALSANRGRRSIIFIWGRMFYFTNKIL
jgi:hypothetical protein